MSTYTYNRWHFFKLPLKKRNSMSITTSANPHSSWFTTQLLPLSPKRGPLRSSTLAGSIVLCNWLYALLMLSSVKSHAFVKLHCVCNMQLVKVPVHLPICRASSHYRPKHGIQNYYGCITSQHSIRLRLKWIAMKNSTAHVQQLI